MVNVMLPIVSANNIPEEFRILFYFQRSLSLESVFDFLNE